MFDVIEVDIETRRGDGTNFFDTVPAGKYATGDTLTD